MTEFDSKELEALEPEGGGFAARPEVAILMAIKNICLIEIGKNLKLRNEAPEKHKADGLRIVASVTNYHQGKINAFTQILELIEKKMKDRV